MVGKPDRLSTSSHQTDNSQPTIPGSEQKDPREKKTTKVFFTRVRQSIEAVFKPLHMKVEQLRGNVVSFKNRKEAHQEWVKVKKELLEESSLSTKNIDKACLGKPISQRTLKEEIKNLNKFISSKFDDPTNVTDEDRDAVNRLYFDVLAHFNEEFFDRNEISDKVANELEASLSPKLPEREYGPEEKYPATEKMIALLEKLGIVPEKNKGAAGSLIYKSLRGRKIAIFKHLKPKEAVIAKKIEDLAKKIFGIRRQRDLMSGGLDESTTYAEVLSYNFDKAFNFGVVPDTQMTRIKDEKGSLQVFVDGYQEAKEVMDEKRKLDPDETRVFQKFVVFDYLGGNLDRHGENWLVKIEEGKLKSIAAIDNGKQFPAEHPKEFDFIALKNQYAWRKYPFAEQLLDSEIKDFILRELTEERLVEFFNSQVKRYRGQENAQDFFKGEIMGCTLRRLAVLRKWAESGQAKPSELGEIRTDEAIDEFLRGK